MKGTTSVRKKIESLARYSAGSIGMNLMGSQVKLSAIMGDASVPILCVSLSD